MRGADDPGYRLGRHRGELRGEALDKLADGALFVGLGHHTESVTSPWTAAKSGGVAAQILTHTLVGVVPSAGKWDQCLR